MRLKERSLTEIAIAARVEKSGELGGVSEGFSGERTMVRGSVLPAGGSLDVGEKGLSSGTELRILVPADTAVQPGDALFIGDARWIVKAVECWSAHLEIRCGEKA